jgi:hypothetical protein
MMVLGWTADDVERAKGIFRENGSAQRYAITAGLWQHWLEMSSVLPDKSIFGDPEEDLALLLHARAYGMNTPWTDDLGMFGELLRAREGDYAPLVPRPLPFGPAANLSPSLGASLEAPAMDVWIYKDGDSPVAVLIFGAGIPGVREDVFADAFMTSLRVGTMDTDAVGTSFVRVEVSSAARTELPLPVNVLGRAGALLPASSTAQEAMERFVGRLRRIADGSGLIRLHDAADIGLRALESTIIERAIDRAPDNPATVWAPGLAMRESDRVAGLIPYLTLPHGLTLQLPLSQDLLSHRTYLTLAAAYRGSTLDRMVADARARHTYHVEEARRLRSDHEAYKKTPAPDRVAVWGAFVPLTHWYDFDTDRAIRLPFPEKVDAEEFYLRHVPLQADRHEKAAEGMQKIVDDVATAEASQQAPVPRLIAGCLLDGTLRQRCPSGTDSFKTAFAGWSEHIRPMLCFEWRRSLRSRLIDPADVFGRHTIVHTYFAEDGETLLAVPLTVVDSMHSAVLLDNERRVVTVRDPTDFAVERATTQAAEKWADLVNLAEGQGTNPAEFATALTAALRESPREIIAKTMAALSGTAGAESQEQNEVAAVEDLLPDITKGDIAVSLGMTHAGTALIVGALHTARTRLAALRAVPGELGARVALMEATVEFLGSGRDHATAYEYFSQPEAAGLPDLFEEAVKRARLRCQAFTDEWVALLDEQKHLDFGRVVMRLLVGLPEPTELFEKKEQAALLARTGAEAYRLARNLEQAADRLSDLGEPGAVPFAKLGRAVEDLFLAEYAGGVRADALELLAILTGQSMTRAEEA